MHLLGLAKSLMISNINPDPNPQFPLKLWFYLMRCFLRGVSRLVKLCCTLLPLRDRILRLCLEENGVLIRSSLLLTVYFKTR